MRGACQSASWLAPYPTRPDGHQLAHPLREAAAGAQAPRRRRRRAKAPTLSSAAGYAAGSNFNGGSSISSSSSSSSAPAQLSRSTVKVYEAKQASGGKRIVAETQVQAPVDMVWRVLTNYERLASFVPNLESCQRLPSSGTGQVLIRQRGCSQGVLWRLEAEAVIAVEEVRLPLGRREARFSMVEGDFKEMSGRWVVEPDPSSAVGMATLLRFDITVQPKISLPSSVVSYVVRAGLPANIQAVSRRAEEIAAIKLQASGLARWAGVDDDPPIPVQQPEAERLSWEQEAAEEEAARCSAAAVDQASALRRQAEGRDDALPSKGPFWRLTGSTFPEAAPLTAGQQRQQQGAQPAELQAQKEEAPLLRPLVRQRQADPQSSYLGVVSVPLPPAGNRSTMQPETQDELNQRQEVKEQLQAAYPAFGLRRAGGRTSSTVANSASPTSTTMPAPSGLSSNGSSQAVPVGAAEVHLRRLDTFDMLHRRAVAAVTIDAPPEAVWDVLTDYNRLAEFVPNLAVSQRIALPRNAPANIIRIRQVGYKRMLYMCLHAESVLDLIEKPQSEIQFRQVAGDFERFQGKWMLQGLPSPGSSADGESCASQTQLKYAVEIVIPRSTRMLGVLEPLLERTVFEDVPSNLAAIKQRVESLQAERDILQLEEAGESAAAAALRRKVERPVLSDMVEDFAVLVAELERCFGSEEVLPTRSELREMNRSDLEKAISSHGGPTLVAQQLGWKLKAKGRRPKGYWDSPENVRAELDEFIEEQGLPAGVMPAKNDFVRAGRYDIARAVERWGGLYELAGELGYAVNGSRKPGISEWQEHISELAASTGLSGREGLFELASKTYAARRSVQGSLDVDEEVALADVAAEDARRAVPANNGTNGRGSKAGDAGKAKAKRGRGSIRDEIDEWE